MTDPRIEAAARELKRLFSDDESTTDDTWIACAKCVMDAADTATWRPIESAPDAEEMSVLTSNMKVVVGFKQAGSWYFGSNNRPISKDVIFTHWQPLPKPLAP